MVTFGISTWSIHRALSGGSCDLLDVPAAIREHGMTDLQVCHFHLPSRDSAWLKRFRDRIDEAGVTFNAMLLDFGDLSHPERSEKDAAELAGWLETAAELGAKFARISAGLQPPTSGSLQRSADHLLHLSDVGDRLGVKVITENWQATLPGSAEVMQLRDLTGGRVRICIDFGNWSGPNKYEELQRIAPTAVTAHAKCGFSSDMQPNTADFARCLQILKQLNFDGTIALIYDGSSPDEWRYLDVELQLSRSVYPA